MKKRMCFFWAYLYGAFDSGARTFMYFSNVVSSSSSTNIYVDDVTPCLRVICGFAGYSK